MSKDAVAPVHSAVVDRIEANGANPVKQSLAHREMVQTRRRWSAHPQMHVARIVHEAAESGVRLQPAAAWQVNGTRRDIVDRSATVVLDGRNLFHFLFARRAKAKAKANARFGDGRLRRSLGALRLLDPLIRRQAQAARKHLHGRSEILVE